MRKLVMAAAVAVLGLTVTPAVQATPGSGVSSVIVKQVTVGATDYILREVTIQPGGYTGWHYHRGTLYALVKSGSLAHMGATCDVHEYGTGQAFVEPSGAGNIHIGRNPGQGVTVLEVLYVNPAGSALSEDAPNPGCWCCGRDLPAEPLPSRPEMPAHLGMTGAGNPLRSPSSSRSC